MNPTRIMFGGTIFLAAFLLFLVEPMAAKQLLPIFGGSAAVWITCLVFFQTALLCAYLYAHWLTRSPAHPRPIRWILHLALLAIAAASAIFWSTLSPAPQLQGLGEQSPVLAIFSALLASIGLPFLALGATSPLLQVWLARIETNGVPWRLFALSNLASLLALALYPAYIEPNFTLHTQRVLWTATFLLFAALCSFLTWKTREATSSQAAVAAGPALQPTPLSRKLLWLLLPMGAAMQLSAITSHLTENIAAIPLLWILPLAVYLITLILAFQFPRLTPRWLIVRLLAVFLASLAYTLSQPDGSFPLKISIPFLLAELFFAALFLHTEAYRLRPNSDSEATLFYLLFAAGGALGSFLTGIASPLIFNFNFDLAIAYLITAALAFAVLWSTGWGPRLLWATAVVLLAGLIVFLHTAYERNTPVAVRNFYGSLRVRQTVGYPGAEIRTLSNGTIQHGMQIFSADLRTTPTTYYAYDSGIGLTLRNCCPGRPRNVGVVGLGTGTLAAYGQPGDRFRFYEINPAVPTIAQDVFTYLRESHAQITIVPGDARTSLTRELAENHPQSFDVLVIDAFSGDAIPLHLLTTQALELYKRHLAPGAVLAIHISNQHVDLEPEVALLAQATGFKAMRVASPSNPERGEFSATWMLLSQSPDFFSIPEIFNNAHQPTRNPRVRAWTDDYSSLLPILRW